MTRGIRCPKCDGLTRVTTTRRLPGGVIVRYRRCRAGVCRGRVITEERPRKRITAPA